MQLSTHASTHDDPLEGSIAPADAGLLLALPTSTLVLGGCFYHALHHGFLAKAAIGPYGLVYSGYLTLAPLFVFCGVYAMSVGKNGVWAVAGGAALAFVAIANFRGSYYWPGTFNMAHAGYLHTALPVLLGLLLGVALAWRKRRLRLDFVRKSAWLTICAAVGWSWVDSMRDIGMYTTAPYSQHYALTAVVCSAIVVALLCSFADR